MVDDRRPIEDYLLIHVISAEASREESVRKGHISTLHRWWARRPLVACRAATYATLALTILLGAIASLEKNLIEQIRKATRR